MKIPQGYKYTELGIIPEDWEIKQISEFTDIITGGTPNTSLPEYWGGDIKWMNSGELNLKFVKDVEGRITNEGLNNSSTHLIPTNCVLIGLAGQGKTRGTAAFNLIPLCTNQSIAAILPSNEHNSLYLYYVVDSLYESLRLLSSGDGGRGGLNKNLLNSLQIKMPKSIEEQRRIAEVLSDVDGLITALDKKIAKKKLIKQATMQQLLTGKKRLQGFSDVWENMQLGDIVNIVMGQSPSSKYYNTTMVGLPLIQGNADMENRKTIIRIYSSQITKKCDVGDIILSVRAPVGSVGLATYESCIGRGVCAIKNTNNYLYYYLIFNENNWEQYSKGSTFDSINHDELVTIPIKLPKSVAEQQAIATILSDIDAEISDLERKRDKYKLLKNGMMQKLLTGQIRLTKPMAPIIPLQTHVIAGHIVNSLYNSRGWGRTKLQKTIHLVAYHCQLDLGNEFIRNTAGPDDQRMMNYIDQKLKQYRHVRIDVKRENGKHRYIYTPTAMIDEVEQVYEQYPQPLRVNIDSLLDKIKTMDLSRAEIVSTLYAVWNNRIIRREPITDDLLLTDFYNWSAHKSDFSRDLVLRGLNYMRNVGIVPIGWGNYINNKKEDIYAKTQTKFNSK